MLIQWVYVSNGVNKKTISSYLSFTTVPTVIVGMLNYLGNTDYYGVGVKDVTTSSFMTDVRDGKGCAWIALGY